jgi:L-cysteine desulfidase
MQCLSLAEAWKKILLIESERENVARLFQASGAILCVTRMCGRRPVMNEGWALCAAALKAGVIPALGCTEPVAAALAAAHARALAPGELRRLVLRVSGNLYKNATGVGVPGTGMRGLPIAAAAGWAAGDAEAGLEVLRGLRPEDVATARALLPLIAVEIVDGDDPLVVDVYAETDHHTARVVIRGGHTRIVLRERDGVILAEAAAGQRAQNHGPLTLPLLFDFAVNGPLEEMVCVQDAARVNTALAEEGSRGYGLKVGATLLDKVYRGLLTDDLMTLAMRLSAAASDARMDGAPFPAMTNSGSGNQGIAATMPVVAAAMLLDVGLERQTRALALAHLMAIHIKARWDSLSALCAAATAAMGAGAAITWLLGGDRQAVENCLHNMIGDVTGIICDGAKTGCALKVSTAASAAVKAALMASDGIRVGADEGIVADSAEQSIANLGELAREGTRETDRRILAIMLAKQAAQNETKTGF